MNHGMSATKLAYAQDYLQSQYISPGRLSGAHLRVVRRGEVALDLCLGMMDRENQKPLGDDTIYRIYSMTKPIVSVALMMLCERGLFRLDEPIERYLPEFAQMRVYVSGVYPNMITKRAKRPITFVDLLTHQSGLTYGFQCSDNVDAAYRQRYIDTMAGDSRVNLAEWSEQLAELPLVFSPGECWNYSVATDVVGRLVEVLAGQSLDEFLAEEIFAPLGMKDTGFAVPEASLERLASCYEWRPAGEPALVDSAADSIFVNHAGRLSGGGGLVSTVDDYQCFCQMLLDEGAYSGGRLLAPATLQYMCRNHIYDGGDMASNSPPGMFSEVNYQGVGFGLGFSVQIDAVAGKTIGSPGEFAWGGMASTAFWVDPAEQLYVLFMTQLIPSASYPLRRDLKAMVYGAINN